MKVKRKKKEEYKDKEQQWLKENKLRNKLKKRLKN